MMIADRAGMWINCNSVMHVRALKMRDAPRRGSGGMFAIS